MIAMAVGVVLALLALGYVLYPLVAPTKPREGGPSGSACPKCGALSKPDARFCSNCGGVLLPSEGKDRLR